MARLASRSLTVPSRYTTPRSVTTLKALAERSLASTRLARTLPVMKVSLERCDSVLLGATTSSFTTERTLPEALAMPSTAASRSARGTSPLSSTTRL